MASNDFCLSAIQQKTTVYKFGPFNFYHSPFGAISKQTKVSRTAVLLGQWPRLNPIGFLHKEKLSVRDIRGIPLSPTMTYVPEFFGLTWKELLLDTSHVTNWPLGLTTETGFRGALVPELCMDVQQVCLTGIWSEVSLDVSYSEQKGRLPVKINSSGSISMYYTFYEPFQFVLEEWMSEATENTHIDWWCTELVYTQLNTTHCY